MRSGSYGLLIILTLLTISASANGASAAATHGMHADSIPAVIQFVYTSDVHFGITRHNFRGDSNVDARIVNARMVAKINALPGASLPQDSG